MMLVPAVCYFATARESGGEGAAGKQGQDPEAAAALVAGLRQRGFASGRRLGRGRLLGGLLRCEGRVVVGAGEGEVARRRIARVEEHLVGARRFGERARSGVSRLGCRGDLRGCVAGGFEQGVELGENRVVDAVGQRVVGAEGRGFLGVLVGCGFRGLCVGERRFGAHQRLGCRVEGDAGSIDALKRLRVARLRLIERVDESGKAIALGLRIVEVRLRLLCSLVRLIRRRLSELVLTLRVAQGSCGRCSAFCCLLLGCSRRVEVTLGVRKRFRRFVEGVLRAATPPESASSAASASSRSSSRAATSFCACESAV